MAEEAKTVFEIVTEVVRAAAPPKANAQTAVDRMFSNVCKRCLFSECLCGHPAFEEFLAQQEKSNS